MEFILKHAGVAADNEMDPVLRQNSLVSIEQLERIYRDVNHLYGAKNAAAFYEMVMASPVLTIAFFSELSLLLEKMNWLWNPDYIDFLITSSKIASWSAYIEASEKIKEEFYNRVSSKIKHKSIYVLCA